MTTDRRKLRQARRALETAATHIEVVRDRYRIGRGADKQLNDTQEDIALALEATEPGKGKGKNA